MKVLSAFVRWLCPPVTGSLKSIGLRAQWPAKHAVRPQSAASSASCAMATARSLVGRVPAATFSLNVVKGQRGVLFSKVVTDRLCPVDGGIARSEPSEEQLLAPLPPKCPKTGRPTQDRERTIWAILWGNRTGSPRRDLSAEFGPYGRRGTDSAVDARPGYGVVNGNRSHRNGLAGTDGLPSPQCRHDSDRKGRAMGTVPIARFFP